MGEAIMSRLINPIIRRPTQRTDCLPNTRAGHAQHGGRVEHARGGEFALVLPSVAVDLGIMELGRLMVIYTGPRTAAGSCYGSAAGLSIPVPPLSVLSG
jgi:hypothetical protein